MALQYTSKLHTDSRLYITDNDEWIRDRLFKELIDFQPTMGWMFVDGKKLTLAVDDRYFEGVSKRLNGKKVIDWEWWELEVTVVNVKEKIFRILEVLSHIQKENSPKTVTLSWDLVCWQILEMFKATDWKNISEETKKEISTRVWVENIKIPQIIIEWDFERSLTEKWKQILLQAQNSSDYKRWENLYITDSSTGMRDDHFLYFLWFQPEYWAILHMWNSYTIVISPQDAQKFTSIQWKWVWDFSVNIMTADSVEESIIKALQYSQQNKVFLSDLMSFNTLLKILKNSEKEFEMSRPNYEMQRNIKTSEEIEYHKWAIAIIEKVFEYIEYLNAQWKLKWLKERDLVKIVQEKIIEFWGEGEAFPTIASVGVNGAVPHHIPTETVPWNDEVVDWPMLFDIWALYNGRCSDFTRVLWVGEKKGEKYKHFQLIENLTYDIHIFCLEIAREWMTVGDLDSISKKFALKKATENSQAWEQLFDYLEYPKTETFEQKFSRIVFSHGLGHGVGIRIHEFPFFTRDKDVVLKKWMFITIEPGIYIPWYMWCRLENLYYVGDDGKLHTDNQVPLKSSER